MLQRLVAAFSLLFISAAAAQETPECQGQTRLCNDAAALLSQCQSQRLDCTAISKQADSICTGKTIACSSPTQGTSLGTQAGRGTDPVHKPLPDQIEVGGENTSGFGAIAFSPSNRSWGESFGYGSRTAAERRAMKECRDDAKDCQLAVIFYRQCGAVAGDDKGIWGSGVGPTPDAALREAMAACAANNGKDCEVERVTCTR